MRKAIIGVVAVSVVVFGAHTWGKYITEGKVSYSAPEVVEKTVEVTVPELEKRIMDALAASSTEIEAAMQKASQDAKDKIEGEIKLRVNRQMQEELKAEESKLEEQVSL